MLYEVITSISDGEREFNFLEKLFYFGVHGCSANNNFFEATTQRLNEFFANLTVNLVIQQWNAERPFP